MRYVEISSFLLNRFESQPFDNNLNAQFVEEDVIPSAGHAKSLKDKFLTLEKEASRVETASSKMTYVPKKFTSPSTNKDSQQQQFKQQTTSKVSSQLYIISIIFF